MKTTKSKIIKLAGSILTGIFITVLSSLLVDFFKDFPFWTSITKFFTWIYSNVFLIQVDLWVILIALLCYRLLSILYRKIKKSKSTSKRSEPRFLSYQQDYFDDFLWRWDYNKSIGGSYIIEHIRPYCPKCNHRMSYGYKGAVFGFRADCPQCNFTSDEMKSEKDIHLMITDKIEHLNEQ